MILGQSTTEVSMYLEASISILQNPQLQGYYLLLNLINQVLDNTHNWKRMVFVELMYVECCCMRTQQAVKTWSNHLIDS